MATRSFILTTSTLKSRLCVYRARGGIRSVPVVTSSRSMSAHLEILDAISDRKWYSTAASFETACTKDQQTEAGTARLSVPGSLRHAYRKRAFPPCLPPGRQGRSDVCPSRSRQDGGRGCKLRDRGAKTQGMRLTRRQGRRSRWRI